MALDIEEMKKRLEESFNDGTFEKWVMETNKKDAKEAEQLERFHNHLTNSPNGIVSEFSRIVEKIINHYNSKKYRDKWYNIGYEPPERLYSFILKYAAKYGKECTPNQYKKYGNDFTTGAYIIHDYYVGLMQGQGASVQIFKIETELSRLLKSYTNISNKLIKQFVKKHEYEFDYWISDEVGGLASFVEYYTFNFSDIVEDLTNNYPKGKIFEWFDWLVEKDKDLPYMNLRNYVYHKDQILEAHNNPTDPEIINEVIEKLKANFQVEINRLVKEMNNE